VGAGAAGSFSINVLGPRIVAGNFEPGYAPVSAFLQAGRATGAACDGGRRMRFGAPPRRYLYRYRHRSFYVEHFIKDLGIALAGAPP
jgi:hypothetical protein